MLFHEIKPFADAHIDAVDKILTDLSDLMAGLQDTIELPFDKVKEIVDQLESTQRALYRFRDCAIDEWKMKERLEERVRNCRLNHR